MSIEPFVAKSSPMFEMLYHSCPVAYDGPNRTYQFEIDEGVMTIKAETITDSQDIDVLGFYITDFSMNYENQYIQSFTLTH